MPRCPKAGVVGEIHDIETGLGVCFTTVHRGIRRLRRIWRGARSRGNSRSLGVVRGREEATEKDPRVEAKLDPSHDSDDDVVSKNRYISDVDTASSVVAIVLILERYLTPLQGPRER